MGGTGRDTAVAVHALAFIHQHQMVFRIVGVDAVGTLAFADPAAGAAGIVANNFKFRRNIVDYH